MTPKPGDLVRVNKMYKWPGGPQQVLVDHTDEYLYETIGRICKVVSEDDLIDIIFEEEVNAWIKEGFIFIEMHDGDWWPVYSHDVELVFTV